MKKGMLVSLVVCLGLLLSLFPSSSGLGYQPAVVQAQDPRNVDIVFVMDTSGSMDDEFLALCGSIEDMVASLLARGIGVRYQILGITKAQDCASTTVQQVVDSPTVDDQEDWGPAIRDISVAYGWEPNATRLIIAMSDEAPEDGNDCSVPGPDEDAINLAVTAAKSNRVRVAPILCSGHDQCIADLAQRLADGTGGQIFYSFIPANDLAAGIESLIGAVIADKDGDGLADDEDPYPDDACQPDPQAVCLPRQVCGMSNTPHWDDDGDSQTDEELPNDQDDDGDGLVDEDVGGSGCPYPEQDCGVNSHRDFDDDADGQADEEIDNGVDDDGDSYIDEDVNCPCPPAQDMGVDYTPNVDDDHDFAVGEEADDGIDNDGDGCVDEDIGSKIGPDFVISSVSIYPIEPKEMEVSKIVFQVQNIGDSYQPQTGQFQVVVTARAKDSPDYWRYTYQHRLTGDPSRMGDSFTIEPFLFLYSGKYEVEVEFSLLGEEETDTTNNSKLSRVVSVAPDPVDLAPCGRLLVDVVIVAAETLIGPGASGHAEMMIDLAEIAEKLINLIALGFACKKDGEYLTNEDVIECQLEAIDMLFDQMIKELANLFVEHGLATNMKNFLAKFGAKLIAHFILGLKHAVQCGWELGDVLIRLVKNIRNHGQDMSAVLVESPLNVLVTNSKGQRVGILADGSAVAEIEGSEVLVEGDVKILAYPGADTTSVALDGTGTGSFDLTVALSQPGTDQVQAASYTDVPISAASIGSVDLDGDFALNLDDDGDGVIDRRVAPSLPPSKDSAPGGGQGIVLIVLIIAVGAVALVVVANRRRQPAFPTPETSEPTRAQLIVVRGEQAGSVFPLGVSDLAIGRSQAAGLPLSHGRVSRRHAVIRYAQGRWFIQDQGSTHGTYVSGQRVEATALNPGDRITIGDTEFEFRIG